MSLLTVLVAEAARVQAIPPSPLRTKAAHVAQRQARAALGKNLSPDTALVWVALTAAMTRWAVQVKTDAQGRLDAR